MNIRSFFRRPGRPAWMRAGPLRGMSLAEVSAMLLAVAVALLCSCHDRPRDPVVVVDPGPPFPRRPVLRGVHELPDGTTVVLLSCETGAR